jgi:oligopeptide transport system permease protein
VLRFAVSRLAQGLASLFLAASVLFLVVSVLPGDPVRALFGFRPVPPDVYDSIVEAYRFDQPLWKQYVLFLADLARGDFGRSLPQPNFAGAPTTTIPVEDVIAATAGVSARLVLAALVVQLVVGLGLGALAAHRPRSGRWLQAIAVVMVAAPVVVVAFVLRWAVGYELGWLPVGGLYEGAVSYVLPVLALAALSTGYVALLARAELGASLRAAYVRSARARGYSEPRVLLRHALRPALGPVVAFVAINLGPTLLGLIAVEAVFDLPGLGGTIVSAVRGRDRGLLVGLVAFTMAVVIAANAVADVVVAWIDPRLRTGSLT